MPDTMSDINADLDLTFLNEIADGSDEFIVETIELFLEQAPLILQEVRDAIYSADWVKATSAAHAIKANLGFFGMLSSQALITEVESACKDGGQHPEWIKDRFGEASDMISTSLTKLEEIKAEKEANL